MVCLIQNGLSNHVEISVWVFENLRTNKGWVRNFSRCFSSRPKGREMKEQFLKIVDFQKDHRKVIINTYRYF